MNDYCISDLFPKYIIFYFRIVGLSLRRGWEIPMPSSLSYEGRDVRPSINELL